MFILRLLGSVILVSGFGFLAGDFALTDKTGIELHALGWWWDKFHRDSLLLLQPAVERHFAPVIWDPGLQTLLEWPLVPQLLFLGAIIRLAGTKRRGDKLTYLR